MSRPSKRRFTMDHNGFTYVELLVAAVILSMGTIAVVTLISVLSRTPANKRLTEMGSYVATEAMERLKTQTYNFVALGLANTNVATPMWYDRYGNWLQDDINKPFNGIPQYRADYVVSHIVSRTGGTQDLLEIKVVVSDVNQCGTSMSTAACMAKTTHYEIMHTLVTFGGE